MKIVIIGAGEVADNIHLPTIRKIRGLDVVAVCDIDKNKAEKFAAKWKIPTVCTNVSDVLDIAPGAIVDICTTPNTHVDIAVEAMKAGHHIILEKPIALTKTENNLLWKEYQKYNACKGIKLCVLHTFLFEQPILDLRSLLEKENIDVLSANIEMLHTPEDEMFSNKNHWVHVLSVGRIEECLIHSVYLLRHLIGVLNIRDIYAVKRSSLPWVNYDELNVTFDADGRFGSIYISFNSRRWTTPASIRIYGKQAIINLDGTNITLISQRDKREGYCPSKKTNKVEIVLDGFQNGLQMMMSSAKSAMKVITGKWNHGHKILFRDFLDSITHNNELIYSADEAFQVTETYLELLDRIRLNNIDK